MKKNNWGNRDKNERTFLATTLADAAEKALLAARVGGALRRGTFVLWAGGFLAGVAAYWGDQDAATTGRNVAVVLSVAGAASVGVEFLVALRRKLRRKTNARDRRTLVLSAAKRLEKRFPERTADIVAAVDFSFEERKDDERTPDSNALREATVVAATRRYTALAATLDKAELAAALTGLPSERFRKMERKYRLCALAVLVNLVIWGISGEKEEIKAGRGAAIARKQVDKSKILLGKSEENRGDKENSEIVEERKKREEGKIGENGGADEREAEARVAEEISLPELETLISELAQNAEIAEALKEELERVVEKENKEGAKRETWDDATTFLQLARELRANLTRPETGLVAQTRRLSEAARRERQKAGERLINLGKINEIGEIGRLEEGEKARKISGKEVAVFLTALRLTELESRLTVAGGIGDARSLGLSRILRSGSAIERRNVTSEAASRVAEWGATLRREETAARILSESWRFDAASQRRRTLVDAALQENRAALARFAGRPTSSVGETTEDDESLNEAKRRFNALWGEARLAETESVAIFERLRERLQSEEAREFREFAETNVGTSAAARVWSAEADKAVDVLFCDFASRNEAVWGKIAENVENNRFGRAAEDGENAETTLGDVVPTLGSVEGEVDEEKTEKTENVGSGDRRFSALAAALTQGVDALATQREKRQEFGLEEGKGNKENGRSALSRSEAEKSESSEGANEDAALEKREAEIETTSQNDSREEEASAAKEDVETSNDVTVDKERSSSIEATDGVDAVDGENKKEKDASGGESGDRNGANANGFAGKGSETEKEGTETETSKKQAFNGELPFEARRRFEGTEAPEITPEYAEKIRLYRLRILKEERR